MVGDYVLFGTYEQDNDKANGKEDIEWLVLDKEDEKILVISRYALDCKPYNTKGISVTWESCSLRRWLNDSFLSIVFTEEERSMIPFVTVSADGNPDVITNPGNDTTDQVFLLSITEANKYLSSNEERQCAPTAFAIEQGCVNSDTCWWWLRSPGGLSHYAVSVGNYGRIDSSGFGVDYSFGVSHALWIDLSLVDAS